MHVIRYQSVGINNNIGYCEYILAKWDDGETIPQYSNIDGVSQWTFNYMNGQITEQCPTLIQFEIVWICDPDAIPFSMDTVCTQINECKHKLSIKSAAACSTPSYNDTCKWGDLNLQELRGYQIECLDQQYTYDYTPCFDYTLCDGNRYQSVLFNRDIGECEYYLSQWDYGQVSPKYINDNGNPVWRFDYNNGQETERCPDGIEFEVNYICKEECVPFCLHGQCNQVNECRHQMAIETTYACVTDLEMIHNQTHMRELLSMDNILTFSKV